MVLPISTIVYKVTPLLLRWGKEGGVTLLDENCGRNFPKIHMILAKKIAPAAQKHLFLVFSERLAAFCTKKFAPAARIFYFSDFLSQLTRSWDPPGKGGD